MEEVNGARKQIGRVGGLLLAFLYLLMAVIGFLWAYLSVFEAEYEKSLLLWGVLLISFLFGAVYAIPKASIRMAALAAVLLGYGIWIFYQWENILSGAVGVFEGILYRVNEHYQSSYVAEAALLGNARQQTVFLLAGLFPVIMILGVGIIRSYRWGIVTLILLLPVLGAMVVGDFPSLGPLILMALSLLAAAGGRRMKSMDFVGRNTALGMIVIAMIALVFGLLSLPAVNRTYEKQQSKLDAIKNFVNEDLWSVLEKKLFELPFGNSGAVGGDLRRGELIRYGTEEIQVTADEKPSEALYLRGFVGNAYTGDEWLAADGGAFEKYAVENGWQEEEIGLWVANQSFQTMQRAGILEKRRLTVNRIHASSRYAYLPYWSEVPDAYQVEGDGAIEGIADKEATVSYFETDAMKSYEITSIDEKQQLYKQYVYENYLDYPAEQLSRLEAQCMEREFSNLEEIKNFVSRTLYRTAVYDLEAEASPEGVDFTEHFLYEQKRGYCVHFATAATLMYRMCGVPARYVTGYIAPTNTFFPEKEGSFTATLKDDMAHAWTEIYTDAGWVPVEATPPYVSGEYIADGEEQQENQQPLSEGQQDQQPPQSEEQEAQPTESPAKQEVEASPTPTKAAAEEEEKQEEAEKKAFSIRPGQVAAALCILLAIGFVATVLWSILRKWWRYRNFRTRQYNDNLRYIYKSLYEAMVFDGMPKEITVSDVNFAAVLAAKYPVVTEDEVQNFAGLVLQANFGPLELTAGDTVRAIELYKKICRHIVRTCGWRRRVSFRTFKGFF